MQQAEDFREISDQVADIIAPLNEPDFERTTGFKSWSINAILRHLHLWNRAAYMSLREPNAFDAYMAKIAVSRGKDFREFESAQLHGLSGFALFEAWRGFYDELADAFSTADPKARVKWAGPSMSARSSITARLMETWAHAQAIYDELGVDRPQSDAIANIVILGLNTYGWTFKVRGVEAPAPRPQLVLTMASGERRTFGEDAGEERIEGSAQEFCQVVTQCRNIADTSLRVEGANARRWMDIAQCFAGQAQNPPAPGTRVKRSA